MLRIHIHEYECVREHSSHPVKSSWMELRGPQITKNFDYTELC